MNIKKKKIISVTLSFLLMINISMTFLTTNAYATDKGYVSFKYEDFSKSTDLIKLNGGANVDSGMLSMTESGAAYYKNHVSLSNNKSFSTFFTFKMNDYGSREDYGIVFNINNRTSSLEYEAGRNGYSGINNSIGIEFDSHQYSDDRIAVNVNGDVNNPVATATNSKFNSYKFQDGNPYYVWIDYNGDNNKYETGQLSDR